MQVTDLRVCFGVLLHFQISALIWDRCGELESLSHFRIVSFGVNVLCSTLEEYLTVLYLMVVNIVALDSPAVRMKFGFSMFLAVTILG